MAMEYVVENVNVNAKANANVNGVKYCYAYVRISIDEEKPENQRMAIEEWAKANNYVVAKWFEDVGVSGAILPWERELQAVIG